MYFSSRTVQRFCSNVLQGFLTLEQQPFFVFAFSQASLGLRRPVGCPSRGSVCADWEATLRASIVPLSAFQRALEEVGFQLSRPRVRGVRYDMWCWNQKNRVVPFGPSTSLRCWNQKNKMIPLDPVISLRNGPLISMFVLAPYWHVHRPSLEDPGRAPLSPCH